MVHAHSQVTSNTQVLSPLYATAKINKQQAASIAQEYIQGRVLKVSLKGSVYRVKIISTSGDVVTVFIDSKNGQILNQ